MAAPRHVNRFGRAALRGGLPVVAALLAGCDVALISPTLPGIVPGFGQPLTGRVIDSRTGLPLGHATVASSLIAQATTGSDGRFALYRAFGNQLSIARAGYTSVTLDLGPLQPDQDVALDPQFPDDGQLPSRYVNLQGTLTVGGGTPAAQAAAVTFGGANAFAVGANGAYTVPVHEAAPGLVASGVLFGGIVTGGPVTPVQGQAPQPFAYQLFGYRFIAVPMSSDPNAAPVTMATLDASTATDATHMAITYRNLPPGAALETDVALDFGLLGAVPVARTFGSSVDIPLPGVGVASAKYLIDGAATATKGDLAEVSKVSVATPALAGNDFTLLGFPVPRGPADGKGGAGAYPTFSWDAVPGASAYEVEVFENGNSKPKWRGLTHGTSLGYPPFWDGDSNGGALLGASQASYSWAVTATDADVTALVAQDRPLQPYRRRQRAASTSGMGFSR